MTHSPAQLGFEALLQDADTDNRARRFERETGHLPATMEEGLPFFRALVERHHAAMFAADVEEVMRLREEARKLALKLNGGDTGILAGPNAAGRVLERETAAPDGTVPLWGQSGYFIIEAAGMRVRIALEGVFGIGCGTCFWPGFGAYAVDANAPFLSHTGYRSFLGLHGDPVPGFTPETFIAAIIGQYVERDLKGKLVSIGEEYRRPR
jgi:hypothetical protein